MIIDMFLGFNEIRLAEFRLEYLSSKVGHTVIGESRKTHSGAPKELIFTDWYRNLDASLKSKITVLEIPLDETTGSWQREIFSREFIVGYVKEKFPESKFILSDLDEIPSLSQIETLMHCSGIFHFLTPTYYRRWNWKLKDKHQSWARGVCGEISELNELNGGRFASFPNISGEPGVHLSYLGMSDTTLREKISSFAHTELSVDRFGSTGILEYCDFYRINHLGKSRSKGFGLLKIEEPETHDLKKLLSLRFPDFVDPLDAPIPIFIRRFWASMRLSVFLTYQPRFTSSKKSRTFAEELSSFGVVGLTFIEVGISILYAAKRLLRGFSGRLTK